MNKFRIFTDTSTVVTGLLLLSLLLYTTILPTATIPYKTLKSNQIYFIKPSKIQKIKQIPEDSEQNQVSHYQFKRVSVVVQHVNRILLSSSTQTSSEPVTVCFLSCLHPVSADWAGYTCALRSNPCTLPPSPYSHQPHT